MSGAKVGINYIIVLTIQFGESGDSQDVMISHAHKLRLLTYQNQIMFYFWISVDKITHKKKIKMWYKL